MWNWFHKLASPPHFFRIAGLLGPWLLWPSLLLLVVGTYGGLVLAPDETDRWHEPGKASAAALERYLAALAPALESWPVRVEAPERVHATFFRGHDPERLVVGLVNDFAWVWSERREDAGGRPLRLPEGVDVPPAPVEGARVELRLANPPDSLFDAVTGERLAVTREGGRAFVDVPAFDVASVLVIEL